MVPVEIQCPQCSRKFRVGEQYAGRRVKCPKCEGVIRVPPAEKPPSEGPAAEGETTPKPTVSDRPSPQRWYLRTEDGQHFGPASKAELDEWLADGRIDASCQLLSEGWKQWKWADEVFPNLAATATQTQQPAGAVEENPFAGIGEPAQPSRETEENPFAGIGEPVQTSQKEVNPYVSPQEPAGGIGVEVGSDDGGAITPRVHSALSQTRPWVLFLSILGFILGGLMILAGLAMAGMGAAFGRARFGAGFGAAQAVMCLVMSLIYLAPSFYLFQYGQQIGRFLRSSGIRELETALTAQKSFWKLVGILTLVFMALYAVLIVVMVVAGIAFG